MKKLLAGLSLLIAGATTQAQAQEPIKYEHLATDSVDTYVVHGHKHWLVQKEKGSDYFKTAQTRYPDSLDTHIQAESLEELLQPSQRIGRIALVAQPTDSSIVLDETGIHKVATYVASADSNYVFFYDMNGDQKLNRIIDSMQIVTVHKHKDNTGAYYVGMLPEWKSADEPIISTRVEKGYDVTVYPTNLIYDASTDDF